MSARFVFQKKILDNGLTLLGEQRESSKSAAVGFFVKTGARDETKDVSGVSHFLEHMMFKGTAKRSALDINFELSRMGAQANAFTSEENTVYYAAVLTEFFPQAVELLCDMLRPALDTQEFDTEKKVILEEIALYRDRPSHVLFETAMREHFKNHTAGNSVLGTTDSIGELKRDQMKAYFDSRYVPNNMILAASGNFNWQEFTTLGEKYCGTWKKSEADRAVTRNKPVANKQNLNREHLQTAQICLVGEGPDARDDLRYAAKVLACIMGDSTGSRCYWDLIDKGLADSASIDADEMDGTGIVYSYASCSTENVSEVLERLHRIFSNPGTFDDLELERAKTKIATRMVLQGESTMRRLMATGFNWLYRKEYSPLDAEMNKLKQVSRGSIEKLLSTFSFKPVTEIVMLPA